MKLTPRQYAELLYELTRDAQKAELEERLRRFAQFLVRRRATALLPRIFAAFNELWNEQKGIVEIELTSARRVGGEFKTKLRRALGAKTVAIKSRADPLLIGGLTLKINDTIIDGSVRGLLVRLKEALAL